MSPGVATALGGIRGTPSICPKPVVTSAGVSFHHQQREETPMWHQSTGLHPVVTTCRPGAGGDVGLGAVDHVSVAVPYRAGRRPRRRSRRRVQDGQRRSSPARAARTWRSADATMCGTAIPQVNRIAIHPARAGLVHSSQMMTRASRRHHRIISGKPNAQQSGAPCEPVAPRQLPILSHSSTCGRPPRFGKARTVFRAAAPGVQMFTGQ